MLSVPFILSMLLCASICTAYCGSDLSLTLRFNKAVYQIGDHMICDISFTNVSDKAFRFIPIDDFLDATELQFKAENSRLEKGILVQGERLYDMDDLVKDAVVLSPKQSYTRRIEAIVRSHSSRTSDKDNGPLALDFEVSALILRGLVNILSRRPLMVTLNG